MAMVSCTKCAGSVSDRAASCPHCGCVRGGKGAPVAIAERRPAAAAAAPGEPAKQGTVWPWLAAAAGAVVGRQLGGVTAFLGAKMAGVTDEFLSPDMAALVKARDIGPRVGALVGGVAGYIAACMVGPRRYGAVVSVLVGLLVGGAAGAAAGYLAGHS